MENEEKRPKRPRIGQPRPGFSQPDGNAPRFEKVNYGEHTSSPASEGEDQTTDRPYQPRPRQQGYQPRQQGGYQPRQGGYQPRQYNNNSNGEQINNNNEEGGYQPRQQGGYQPRQQGGYQPRQQGG